MKKTLYSNNIFSILITFSALTFINCSTANNMNQCATFRDCDDSEVCLQGTCTSKETNIRPSGKARQLPPLENLDKDGEDPNFTSDEPRCRTAKLDELHLEEVYAQVVDGNAGDANEDGVRNAYDDEFIKISNSSNDAVSLKSILIKVNGKALYYFPKSYCLQGKHSLTLFSKGTEKENVIIANKRLSLSNSGSFIELTDNHNNRFDSLKYGSSSEGSWVRIPITTGKFVAHKSATGTYYSPFTCPDGSNWDGICEASKVADDGKSADETATK